MARPDLMRHRKFGRLLALLGVHAATARGYLEMTWEVAYEAGDDLLGEAGGLEAIVGWDGEAGRLAAALVGSGFVDESPEGLRVHDLWDHAPEYVANRREQEAERKKPKKCGWCSAEYHSRDKRAKFCTDRCRKASHRSGQETQRDESERPCPSPGTDLDGTPAPAPAPIEAALRARAQDEATLPAPTTPEPSVEAPAIPTAREHLAERYPALLRLVEALDAAGLGRSLPRAPTTRGALDQLVERHGVEALVADVAQAPEGKHLGWLAARWADPAFRPPRPAAPAAPPSSGCPEWDQVLAGLRDVLAAQGRGDAAGSVARIFAGARPERVNGSIRLAGLSGLALDYLADVDRIAQERQGLHVEAAT